MMSIWCPPEKKRVLLTLKEIATTVVFFVLDENRKDTDSVIYHHFSGEKSFQ